MPASRPSRYTSIDPQRTATSVSSAWLLAPSFCFTRYLAASGHILEPFNKPAWFGSKSCLRLRIALP